MNKIKQKIATGLGTLLLTGAMLFPLKAQERVIMDCFSQPHNITEYYGSGTQTSDGMDIDGDGISSTLQDQQILEEYEKKNRAYLPSHLNKLNPTEKLDWAKKMIKIDKTSDIPYVENQWECIEFSKQTCINFHGFNIDPKSHPKFDFSNNGRFNMPVYLVLTKATSDNDTVNHSINAILIGDNPLNFYDWYFFEPQNDEEVKPGDWDMLREGGVNICYIDPKKGDLNYINILKFNFDEEDNPILAENNLGMPNPYPSVVLSNPNKDTTPPQVNLISPKDQIFYNSNVNLEYLVIEDQTFLDSCRYKLNNNSWNYINCVDSEIPIFPTNSISGTIPLTSQEGEHDFMFYTKDITKPQGNKTIVRRHFVIDKTKPEITASISHIEGTDSAKVAINVSEKNPNYARYSYNGSDWNYFSSDTLFREKLKQGENILNVESEDKATNFSEREERLNYITDAVEEKTLESYFKVYPNPTTDKIILEYELLKPNKVYAEIYDINGKMMDYTSEEGFTGKNTLDLDLSKLKSGIYIFSFTKDDKTYTKKFIKQ